MDESSNEPAAVKPRTQPSQFTKDEEAVALSFLSIYRDNVKKTAKKCGIPVSVIRFWQEEQAERAAKANPGEAKAEDATPASSVDSAWPEQYREIETILRSYNQDTSRFDPEAMRLTQAVIAAWGRTFGPESQHADAKDDDPFDEGEQDDDDEADDGSADFDFDLPEDDEPNPFARPYAPEWMQNPMRKPLGFVPAPELDAWFRAVFVERSGPLYNRDMWHFKLAHVGFVWTNVPKVNKGNVIVGSAEIPLMGGKEKWGRAREEQQMREWFGKVPDFLITLDGTYCWGADDREFCRLVFHELRHCRYKTDDDGEMLMNTDKETDEETPSWKGEGHHVEDFVDGMVLFGKTACAGRGREFVEASTKPPVYSDAAIARACGHKCVTSGRDPLI